jgi:hypothetical protein
MDQICLAFPVQEGTAEAARAFMRDLDDARRDEYDRSERRLGISKEVWFLAPTPAGELLVGYIEAEDFATAAPQFFASQDPFDLWFKQQMLEVTGIDLNDPPELRFPELLSIYQAPVPA